MAAPTVNVLCKLFAAFLLFYLTFVKQAFSQKFLPENTHYEEVKILVGTKSSVLLFLCKLSRRQNIPWSRLSLTF